MEGLGAPDSSQIRSTRRSHFGANGSLLLRPVELFASLADLTQEGILQPSLANGDFSNRAFDDSVTLLVVGYRYDVDWVIFIDGSLIHWNII